MGCKIKSLEISVVSTKQKQSSIYCGQQRRPNIPSLGYKTIPLSIHYPSLVEGGNIVGKSMNPTANITSFNIYSYFNNTPGERHNHPSKRHIVMLGKRHTVMLARDTQSC